MRFKLLLLGIACLATPAIAGPFGIQKGQPLKSLAVLKKGDEAGTYIIKVPSPNKEFSNYGVLATPQDGVCAVFGIGKDYEFDSYGKEIRAAFDTIRNALNSKYNIGRMTDNFTGPPGTDIEFGWVLSIKHQNRIYKSTWNQQLPDGLSDISLSVEATSSINSYLLLEYNFDNLESCRAHLPQVGSSGL